MSIAFEGVSYSYSAPAQRTSRFKRTSSASPSPSAERASRRAARKGGLSAGSEGEKALWGNDPHAVWALRNIDFTLEDGEFFGIAGHTGSGKSTLIQHMNGLVHPTSGRVLVDGQDLSDKKVAAQARGRVGLVFQYPEHQLFAATVYDDIAFGPRNMGLSAEEIDGRVRKSLYQVGLDFEQVQQKSPFELSGGQQRRVAFAGVLAMEPSTLILDEPVAGLDPAARMDFLDFIAQLHQQGLTVAMVSHSMNNLAHFCDRILVLKEGEQFALGTPEEVFARAEELNAIGLGVPSAQRMANSLKDAGIPLDESLYNTERLADELAALYQDSAPRSEVESTEQMFHVKHRPAAGASCDTGGIGQPAGTAGGDGQPGGVAGRSGQPADDDGENGQLSDGADDGSGQPADDEGEARGRA